MHWERKLIVWGMLMALAAAAPALLVLLMPVFGDGFFGTVAILLTLTVTPLGLLVASAGVLLLLVAALTRGRS